MKYYLAIDIGASSGRHIVGWQEDGQLFSKEVYRFANDVQTKDGHLTWDIEKMFNEIINGIKQAFLQYSSIQSVAIDTWGVDYVLMNGDQEILPCYAYRDSRTETTIPQVHQIISFNKLYKATGIEFQPFNTIYQLYDDLQKGRLDNATDFLMMPEYFSYKLTGIKAKEYTNATTTGMVSAIVNNFHLGIAKELGLPLHLFGHLQKPGTVVGKLKTEIADFVGGQLDVVLCASHDTASAVEGIPMDTDNPYISSGTWSLLGVKVPRAITTHPNYSNEGGVGYIRYQKNIMGLWLIQKLRKEFCPTKDYGTIATEASQSSYDCLVDVFDGIFLAPQSMINAFNSWLVDHNLPLPQTEQDYFNCAYRSLAYGYKKALAELSANTGKTYNEIYIVGGGAQNKYLNRLTQDICQIKVNALPIEATALGNLKVQMKMHSSKD